MNNSLFLLLLLQVVLIALNAIFASAEIAVLSVNEMKLEKMVEEGNKKAKRLSNLTKDPARFLATIQVAITLSGFLGSAFAADNFSEPLVDWILSLGVSIPRSTLDAISVIIITLILSYFTLIFGELVPKRIAMKKSEQLAMGVSGLVSFISVIFKPIVSLLSMSTNFILRLCGIDPSEEEDQVSEEEIRMMVDVGSEKGAIEHQEKEFIQNVFEFNDIMIENIATHRTDVEMLWIEDNINIWQETINESRHTLFPICEDTADNIIGVLNTKEYFRLEDKNKNNILKQAVQAPYFVLETNRADEVFRNMKLKKHSMAIVIDEYGGMTGIVTFSDLVEELVGVLGDNYMEPEIEYLNDTTWKIKGNIELNVLEDTFGLEPISSKFDTLTGLVFDKLGVIPADGKKNIEINIQNLNIKIIRIEDHQIEEAIIKLID